jgi:hypothetical protein
LALSASLVSTASRSLPDSSQEPRRSTFRSAARGRVRSRGFSLRIQPERYLALAGGSPSAMAALTASSSVNTWITSTTMRSLAPSTLVM